MSILAKIGCLQKIKVFLMKERQGFDATWGFWVARSLGYMMVPFLGGCDALKGVPWAIEKNETEKLDFSAHLRRLKGYSAFTDFIKNQSIGAA